MIIGLPRALEFYRNQYLWQTFFERLKIKTILSPQTNMSLLSNGIKYSIDESCLPAKIYMGHVRYLTNKCDYILVPRIENFGKHESVCVKFNAMYDIVKNTFDAKLLDYNVSATKKLTMRKGFLKMGETLGFSFSETISAFNAGLAEQFKQNEIAANTQLRLLESDALKILVVAHDYNMHDTLIGLPIVEYIKKQNAVVITASDFAKPTCSLASKNLSKSLYWSYNKELVGAVELYKDYVDGIVFITAFPCGPDSLVNELVIRKVKSLPIINIVVDELSAQSGMETRIESFIDILTMRKSHGNLNDFLRERKSI